MKKFKFLIILGTLILIIYLYLFYNKENKENLEITRPLTIPLKNFNTYLKDHDIQPDNPLLKSFSSLQNKSSTDIIFEENKNNEYNDNLEDFDNNLLNQKILKNNISKIELEDEHRYKNDLISRNTIMTPIFSYSNKKYIYDQTTKTNNLAGNVRPDNIIHIEQKKK